MPCLISMPGSLQSPSLSGSLTVSGFFTARSMGPLYKMYVSRASRRSMPPDPCLFDKRHISEPMPQHPYLRALCKIHVSRYITRSAAQEHLQDPCFRGLYKYKTEVVVSMSQHPCLWVHVQAALSVGPLQDPCRRIHCKIGGSMSSDPCLCIYALAALSVYSISKSHVSLKSTTATLLEDPCAEAHVSTSISVDSRSDEAKSGHYSESNSANRKPALCHNETPKSRDPTFRLKKYILSTFSILHIYLNYCFEIITAVNVVISVTGWRNAKFETNVIS